MSTVIIILVVLAVVGFLLFGLKKPGAQLPQASSSEKALPSKGHAEGERLVDKLAEKREQMKEKSAESRPPAVSKEPQEKPVAKEAAPKEATPAEPARSTSDAPTMAATPAAKESSEPVLPAEVAPQVSETKPSVPEAPKPPPSVAPAQVKAVPATAAVAHHKDVAGIRRGLEKSRGTEGFLGRLAALISGKKEIDPAIVADIEEVLITSDVGAKTTQKLLARIKDQLDRNELHDSKAVWAALRAEAVRILDQNAGDLRLTRKPTVLMMVGVNGAGKTTTIGKLAGSLRSNGRSVILAAGDTFRAAAVQQLELWGKRAEVDVIAGKEGADPASVAFEAVQRGRDKDVDLVIIDTAGRLQTKTPLMDELGKIAKTLGKALDGAPHETWLVLDATTGQNAVQQATLFRETLPLTGIVLTKLDGTAKGGVILAIADELGIPVRYVGLGERAADLHEFVAEEYVEALFDGVINA